MVKHIRFIFILIAFGIGITFLVHSNLGHAKSASSSAAPAGGGMPPSMVSVAPAVLQPWQQQIPATGTLTAMQGVMLKSEVPGRITKIYVDSGASVTTGDPLLDIDPGIMQAQLASAIAKAQLSAGDYTRALELFHRGALSKQDLDTALSTKQADAAAVNQAQAQLAQYEIHAPFSGKLGLRQYNLGDYVTAGQALINLQALDPLRVDFTIPENFLGQIQVGDKILLQSDAIPNQTRTGNITAIDSAIDPTTRTIALRALIPNPDQKLLPGGFAQVTLLAGQVHMLPTIPQIAVVYDATGSYVYVVVNQHAIKTPITVGQQNNDQVSVTSGLKVNDQVVVAGQLKIGDGSPVMVMPPGN